MCYWMYYQLLRLYGIGEWTTRNTPTMIMTRKHRSTRSKPCPSDTFHTTKPIRTDLGLSQGSHNDRPPSNRIRGKALSLAVTVVSCIPKHTIIILEKRNKIQVRSTDDHETLHDVLLKSRYTVTCIFWRVQTTCTNWTVIWLGLWTQNDLHHWQLPAAFMSWASFERRRG